MSDEKEGFRLKKRYFVIAGFIIYIGLKIFTLSTPSIGDDIILDKLRDALIDYSMSSQ